MDTTNSSDDVGNPVDAADPVPDRMAALSPALAAAYGVFHQESAERSEAPRGHYKFSATGTLGCMGSIFSKNPFLYLALAVIACLPGMYIKLFYRKVIMLDSLVDLFFSVVFMGAITYGVYRDLTGGRATLGETVARGLKRYLSLAGVSLLLLLGLVLFAISFSIFRGFLALIPLIALVYACCAICVTIPACVVEGLGPVDSVHRSAALTKGCRLAVFGLFAVFFIGVAVIAYVVQVIFPAAIGRNNIAVTILQPVVVAFQEILIAALYYNLRTDVEGVGVDKLATVFD